MPTRTVYNKLQVPSLQVGTAATAGQVLTSDASGNATYQNSQNPLWETHYQGHGTLAASAAAGTWIMQAAGGTPILSSVAQGATTARFPLDAAQHAVAGRTVQCRIVGHVQNASATALLQTYTFGLYSYTSAVMIWTLTAAVGGTTAAVAAPGANAATVAYSTPFTMPATTGNGFTIACVTAGTAAASAAHLTAMLQIRLI